MNYIKNFLMLASVTLLLVSTPWQVQAITISIFNVDSEEGQITNWINGLGGQTKVIENFESYTPNWQNSLDTDVGTFGITNNTIAGTGSSSYKEKVGGDAIRFELRDYNADGRFNTTSDGKNYLDSADITELQLTVKENTYKNLFFYMTDPSDVKAKTTTTASTASQSITYKQNNGSLWFIGINADDDYISEIVWSATYNGDGYTNDGFGLDDFSTVTPVPEPATMLLFGTGIAGLAFITRRKRK